MPPSAAFEAAADAFLQLVSTAPHLKSLRALAVALCGGDASRGHDLYADVLLEVHGHVQRKGFAGPPADLLFYFVRALKNKATKPVPLVLPDPVQEVADTPSDEPDPERAHLAEQVFAEVRERFSLADRVLLRLHLDGFGPDRLSQATGVSKATCWRRVAKMLAHLRAEFGQAFAALTE